MTENEKRLLQAKHRLEEAQMRNRQKERKARTRRLIQEGAILEKALPQTTQITLEQLEDFCAKYSNQYDDFMSDRLSVAFSFSRRAHLLTTQKWAVLLPAAVVRSPTGRALPSSAGSTMQPRGVDPPLFLQSRIAMRNIPLTNRLLIINFFLTLSTTHLGELLLLLNA